MRSVIFFVVLAVTVESFASNQEKCVENKKAREFATNYINLWSNNNVDAIMDMYTDDVKVETASANFQNKAELFEYVTEMLQTLSVKNEKEIMFVPLSDGFVQMWEAKVADKAVARKDNLLEPKYFGIDYVKLDKTNKKIVESVMLQVKALPGQTLPILGTKRSCENENLRKVFEKMMEKAQELQDIPTTKEKFKKHRAMIKEMVYDDVKIVSSWGNYNGLQSILKEMDRMEPLVTQFDVNTESWNVTKFVPLENGFITWTTANMSMLRDPSKTSDKDAPRFDVSFLGAAVVLIDPKTNKITNKYSVMQPRGGDLEKYFQARVLLRKEGDARYAAGALKELIGGQERGLRKGEEEVNQKEEQEGGKATKQGEGEMEQQQEEEGEEEGTGAEGGEKGEEEGEVEEGVKEGDEEESKGGEGDDDDDDDDDDDEDDDEDDR